MFDYFSLEFLGGVASTVTIGTAIFGALRLRRSGSRGIKYAVNKRVLFNSNLPFGIDAQFVNESGKSSTLELTRFLFRNDMEVTLNDDDFVHPPHITVAPDTVVFGADFIGNNNVGYALLQLEDHEIRLNSIALASGEAVVFDIVHSGGVSASIDGLPKSYPSIKKIDYRSTAGVEIFAFNILFVGSISLGTAAATILEKSYGLEGGPWLFFPIVALSCLPALILYRHLEGSKIVKRVARVDDADDAFLIGNSPFGKRLIDSSPPAITSEPAVGKIEDQS